ncbi:MAG: hypothetical protein ABSH48_13530 [Verrucomicrobiota bacterium]|jgi:hypothetical protein
MTENGLKATCPSAIWTGIELFAQIFRTGRLATTMEHLPLHKTWSGFRKKQHVFPLKMMLNFRGLVRRFSLRDDTTKNGGQKSNEAPTA